MGGRLSEVTNLIEPVLLTKLHIGDIGKSKVSDLTTLLGLLAITYGLKLNRVSDFRVAVKLLEDSVRNN
jgi:hypothetical protein